MTVISLRSASTVLCAALLCACGGGDTSSEPLLSELVPAGRADAAGVFLSPGGAEIGHVIATDGPRGVMLRVDLKGLSQGWHGIHLHQTGDCSDGAGGFKASGSHVDPDNKDHGLLNPNGEERADLPNIYAGADGRATAELYADGVALYPSEADAAANGPYPLIDDDGFAVIVHENADDHQTQPIGGAAARVACASLNN